MLKKPNIFHTYHVDDLVIIQAPKYIGRKKVQELVMNGHPNYPYVELDINGAYEDASDPGRYLFIQIEEGNVNAVYNEKEKYEEQQRYKNIIKNTFML